MIKCKRQETIKLNKNRECQSSFNLTISENDRLTINFVGYAFVISLAFNCFVRDKVNFRKPLILTNSWLLFQMFQSTSRGVERHGLN